MGKQIDGQIDGGVLECSTSQGVATLRLMRTQRGNALSAELVEQLILAVNAACADPDVHAMVLCADGPNFCTGFDLSGLENETDASLFYRFVRIEMLLDAIWRAPVRTVACAHGRTWGAGADLFTACDTRAAAPGTTFRFPGAGFGLVLGTRRLTERVGTDIARRCVVDGMALSAEDALTYKLATELVTDYDQGWLDGHCGKPALDRSTIAALRKESLAQASQGDLAALVWSAAPPGLKQRIIAYRARQIKG
jgi:enoyl-CoA hydratase/carnithine racemase